MRESDAPGVRGELATRIRLYLAVNNRTQEWLAGQVGITPKHLSQMLTGLTVGTVTKWEELARVTGLALVVVERDKDGWPQL